MSGPTPEYLARPGSEEAHQTALFCWAALNVCHYSDLVLLFHIPNGGTRNRIEAGFLKASGVRRGVPDVLLPVGRWGLHGLWMEMKRPPNKLSPEQMLWMEKLDRAGYGTCVAYSWQEGRDYLIEYLGSDEEISAHRTFAAAAASIRSAYSRLPE